MTTDNLILKVQKLLRLAGNNSNAEEAGAAAAKAQQLIDEHNLSAAMLALDAAQPEEAIINFTHAPLHTDKQLKRWRGQLAMVIARHNGCKVWRNGGNLMIIGRPSDAETVRYLFAWLEGETERLTNDIGRGCGTTWRDNFRIGVVEAIAAKLKAQHTAFVQATEAQGLVLVNRALARIEDRTASVERWSKENTKLRKRTAGATRYDAGARAAGRAAGSTINIGQRPALGGRKGIA